MTLQAHVVLKISGICSLVTKFYTPSGTRLFMCDPDQLKLCTCMLFGGCLCNACVIQGEQRRFAFWHSSSSDVIWVYGLGSRPSVLCVSYTLALSEDLNIFFILYYIKLCYRTLFSTASQRRRYIVLLHICIINTKLFMLRKQDDQYFLREVS